MQLAGKKLKHRVFGYGKIVKVSGNIIIVTFTSGEKRFLYPDAFSKYLTLTDTRLQKQVDAIVKEAERKRNDEKIQKQQERERLNRLRTLKFSPQSQAVFGLIENDPEEVFSTWTVRTGHYKGQDGVDMPRIPARLRPNCACILTYCREGEDEKERRIIGVFMVPDTFYGTLCQNGIITSHEKYKLKLSKDTQPKFWKYFPESDTQKNWGRTEIKYCSNKVVHQLLADLCIQLKDTNQALLIKNLYYYFCSINRIKALPEIHLLPEY